MTFSHHKLRIRKFANDRGWQQFHTPRNLAAAVSVEAAELLELFRWDNDDPKPTLWSEMADVAIYLIRMADVCGIDLEDAIARKMDANEARYPVDECRADSERGEFRKR